MAPHFSSPPPPHPPTLDSEPFSRPRPRPPRPPAQQAQIRIQNRRREYLARNPSYFESSEHELADPLLYDTLIRRHQTPAEREAEGRARGYARVLEGSLLRGEERLARLAGPARPESVFRDGTAPPEAAVSPLEGVDEPLPPPETKTEGQAQWTHFLRERFVRGGDEEFEYAVVDGDEELDVVERVEREEAWFDEESPGWDLGEEEDGGGDGDVDMDREGDGDAAKEARRKEKELQGETGVQDF
ncbi:coiled-coil domain-containing protein 97 [Podospora conica]|nr:coiled-coil domain-containing protein 97 [Schizothecium conicum]